MRPFPSVATSVTFAASPAAKKPVKIGIVAGMTGYTAFECANLADGAKLAIKEFNQAATAADVRLNSPSSTDGFHRTRVFPGSRLASQGYNLFIGGVSSDIGLAKNQVVKEKTSSLRPSTIPAGMDARLSKDCVAFDMNQDFAKQVEVPPRLAVEAHNAKTVAMLCENVRDRSSTVLSKQVWGGLGVKVVAAELYEMGTTEFRPVLTSIMAKKPDLLCVDVRQFPEASPEIIRQARE